MENAKKSLLTDNKKALQFLHHANGFDFQKEHVIVKGEGRFTFNMVEKEIKNRINGKYTAVVLVKPEKNYSFQDLHYVELDKYKFNPLGKNDVKYWDFHIDYYFGIGDFEESRKKKTERYYIVAQLNDYMLPIDKSENIDLLQRFTYIEDRNITRATDGKGKYWISGIYLKPFDKNVKPFEYRPFSNGMYSYYNSVDDLTDKTGDIIDKSGYLKLVRSRELNRKAKALRAERKNAEATKADYSARENKIRKTTKDIQCKLAEQLRNAEKLESMQNIDSAISKLRWVYGDIERYFNTKDNNKFSSITDIENRLTDIEEKLAEIA